MKLMNSESRFPDRFPLNDPARLQSWIGICYDGFIPTKRSRMCGKHFPVTSFFQSPRKRYRKLNFNAVPEALFRSENKIPNHPTESTNLVVNEQTYAEFELGSRGGIKLYIHDNKKMLEWMTFQRLLIIKRS